MSSKYEIFLTLRKIRALVKFSGTLEIVVKFKAVLELHIDKRIGYRLVYKINKEWAEKW